MSATLDKERKSGGDNVSIVAIANLLPEHDISRTRVSVCVCVCVRSMSASVYVCLGISVCVNASQSESASVFAVVADDKQREA